MMRALFRYADAEHSASLHQAQSETVRGRARRLRTRRAEPIFRYRSAVHPRFKRGPYAEIVTEMMLHALWDAGLIVGHGIRNARECVRMAGTDLKEKTAILDARFLAGDDAIWSELQGPAGRKRAESQSAEIFPDPSSRRARERHAKYGDSIYLLEPQLKEGEGGLRDLHTALWLAKVKYKIHSVEELVQRAIITAPELNEVCEARDFLFRRAQLAAFHEQAPFRPAHLRVSGADRADAGLRAGRLAVRQRDTDARILSARQHHPAIFRRD